MPQFDFLHFSPEDVRVDPQLWIRLPPSARRVFDEVRDHGPLNHEQLRARTHMPARTIRFAMKRLKEEEMVDTRSSLQDCRTCYCFVHRRLVREEALEEARRRAQRSVDRGEKVVEAV